MIAARASTPEYTVIGQVGETGLHPAADGKTCNSDATFSTDTHVHFSALLHPTLPRDLQHFSKQQHSLHCGHDWR